MREADCIKRKLDTELASKGYKKKSFAVSVKGQTFPSSVASKSRVVILQASGYAMANCFEIPKYFRSPKKPATLKSTGVIYNWYLDSIIYKEIRKSAGLSDFSKEEKVQLLPARQKPRLVYAYTGYLWP